MSRPTIILASASLGRKTLLEKLGVPFTVMPSSIDEDAIVDPDLYKMLESRAQAKAEDVAQHLLFERSENFSKNNKENFSRRSKNNQISLYKLLSSKASKLSSNYLIIAADSMAILDGHVFGKSRDKAHAKQIVNALNGRTHEFATATHVIHLHNPSSPPLILRGGKKMKVVPSPYQGEGQPAYAGRGEVKSGEINRWHDLNISLVTTRKMSPTEIDSYVNRYDFTRFAAAYTLNETPWDWITKVEGSYTGVIGLPFEVVLPILRKFNII